MTPPENSLEPLARWVGEKIISFVSPSGKKVKEKAEKRESTPSPPSSPESHLRQPPPNTQRPVPNRKLSRQSPFVPKSALREAAEVFEPHRQSRKNREREQMTPISQPAPQRLQEQRAPDIDRLIDKHIDLFPDEFPVLENTKTELSFSVQEKAGQAIQDAMTASQFLPLSRLAAPKNRQNTGSELRQRDKIAKERETREGRETQDEEWIHLKPPTPIPIPPRILPRNPRPPQARLQSHEKELDQLLGHMHNLKLENKKDARRRVKEEKELQKAAIDNEENDSAGDMFRPSLPEELARPPPRLNINGNTSQSLPSSGPPKKNREVSRGRPRHRRDGASSGEEVLGGILETLNPYLQPLEADKKRQSDHPHGTATDGKAKEEGKGTKSKRKRTPPALQPHGHRPKDENGMIPLMEGQVIVSRKLGEGGKVKAAPVRSPRTYTPRPVSSTYPEKDNLVFALNTKEKKADSVPNSYKENEVPQESEDDEKKLPWTSQGRLERMRRLGPLPGYASESEEEGLPF